jgi:hypothetical protein
MLLHAYKELLFEILCKSFIYRVILDFVNFFYFINKIVKYVMPVQAKFIFQLYIFSSMARK